MTIKKKTSHKASHVRLPLLSMQFWPFLLYIFLHLYNTEKEFFNFIYF